MDTILVPSSEASILVAPCQTSPTRSWFAGLGTSFRGWWCLVTLKQWASWTHIYAPSAHSKTTTNRTSHVALNRNRNRKLMETTYQSSNHSISGTMTSTLRNSTVLPCCQLHRLHHIEVQRDIWSNASFDTKRSRATKRVQASKNPILPDEMLESCSSNFDSRHTPGYRWIACSYRSWTR